MTTLKVLPLMMLALVAVACDRARHVAPATTRAVAEEAPAATTEPASSVLTIGDRAVEFRPARLMVDTRDTGVVARVFSEGATPEGTSDGYYLEMPLEITDPGELDGASWQYTSETKDRADMLSCVTIDGGAVQLQPRDVTVTFRELSPGQVEVRVRGFFNVFRGDGAAAVNTVAVEGAVVAVRSR